MFVFMDSKERKLKLLLSVMADSMIKFSRNSVPSPWKSKGRAKKPQARYEMSNPVEHLDKKTFQIIVIR